MKDPLQKYETVEALLGCSNGLLTTSQLSSAVGDDAFEQKFRTLQPEDDLRCNDTSGTKRSRRDNMMLAGLSPDKNVPLSNTLDEYLRTSQFGLSSELQMSSTY